MPIPRTKKRLLIEYKALLRIDWDWSSTGIWEISKPHQKSAGAMLEYKSLNLPDWLQGRFEYWTNWLEACQPWYNHEKQDEELLNAYEYSLAIDLKRFLGDDYYVECRRREIHDDLEYLQRVNSK